MPKKKLDVSVNSPEGFQIEWHGILLTLHINAHHGISGSIGEMSEDGKNVELLKFHGRGRGRAFPVSFHEVEMDVETKEERPVKHDET